jgi:hypothetical protein
MYESKDKGIPVHKHHVMNTNRRPRGKPPVMLTSAIDDGGKLHTPAALLLGR